MSIADGNPVILANSELETGFQQSASCMSCHVRSTIGPNRNQAASFVYDSDGKDHEPERPTAMRLPVFKIDARGRVTSYNGVPQPGEFLLPGQAAGRPRALPVARFRLVADRGRERQQRQIGSVAAIRPQGSVHAGPGSGWAANTALAANRPFRAAGKPA